MLEDESAIDQLCESHMNYRILNAKLILVNTNPVSKIISPKKQLKQQHGKNPIDWKKQSANRNGMSFGKLFVIGGQNWAAF